MIEFPDAALDLPLRILIREDQAGQTIVVFRGTENILDQLSVPRATSARLVPARQILLLAIGFPTEQDARI